MIKVLFIDDDIELGSIITKSLSKKGYDVLFQNSLSGAKGAITDFSPDIIILDIALNGEDGISFIPTIKDIAPQTPIIIASSHTDYQEIERAFDSGASSFVKKPYIPEELTVYIKKEIKADTPHIIRIKTLSLDTSTRILSSPEKEIKRLSILEYKLIKLLENNENIVVSRDTIEKELWNESNSTSEFSINNLIYSLRKYLKSDLNITIKTIKGNGYCLSTL
jgi:DNA-binding response OmpR family regulator